jgi:triacylglycerol lipase
MKGKGVFLGAFIFLVFWGAVSLPSSARAFPPRQNDCPFVLVGGAMTWGRDELFLYRAWGGDVCDIQEEMRARGYMIHTSETGPFSSTWDRACELYAQIKGGTVDYGLAHSRANSHARFGRTYPGFFPRWGEVDPATGKVRKVHLVGECFGGLTVRFLAQILEEGVAEEIAATPKGQLSQAFSGGHSWVLSVSAIVTPHDGTSVLDYSLIKTGSHTDLLKLIFLITGPGLGLDDALNYDVKLDQWGFSARKGESMGSILNRLARSGILNNRDFCNWDMDPFAISRFNARVRAMPDVYYFSQAECATYKGASGRSYPIRSMLYTYWPLSTIIGFHTRDTGAYVIDEKWFPNDGTVNTISQSGPKVNSTDVIVPFDGVPRLGMWNYLGVINGIDHTDLLGISFGWYSYDPLPWWMKHAALLSSLPDQ